MDDYEVGRQVVEDQMLKDCLQKFDDYYEEFESKEIVAVLKKIYFKMQSLTRVLSFSKTQILYNKSLKLMKGEQKMLSRSGTESILSDSSKNPKTTKNSRKLKISKFSKIHFFDFLDYSRVLEASQVSKLHPYKPDNSTLTTPSCYYEDSIFASPHSTKPTNQLNSTTLSNLGAFSSKFNTGNPSPSGAGSQKEDLISLLKHFNKMCTRASPIKTRALTEEFIEAVFDCPLMSEFKHLRPVLEPRKFADMYKKKTSVQSQAALYSNRSPITKKRRPSYLNVGKYKKRQKGMLRGSRVNNSLGQLDVKSSVRFKTQVSPRKSEISFNEFFDSVDNIREPKNFSGFQRQKNGTRVSLDDVRKSMNLNRKPIEQTPLRIPKGLPKLTRGGLATSRPALGERKGKKSQKKVYKSTGNLMSKIKNSGMLGKDRDREVSPISPEHDLIESKAGNGRKMKKSKNEDKPIFSENVLTSMDQELENELNMERDEPYDIQIDLNIQKTPNNIFKKLNKKQLKNTKSSSRNAKTKLKCFISPLKLEKVQLTPQKVENLKFLKTFRTDADDSPAPARGLRDPFSSIDHFQESPLPKFSNFPNFEFGTIPEASKEISGSYIESGQQNLRESTGFSQLEKLQKNFFLESQISESRITDKLDIHIKQENSVVLSFKNKQDCFSSHFSNKDFFSSGSSQGSPSTPKRHTIKAKQSNKGVIGLKTSRTDNGKIGLYKSELVFGETGASSQLPIGSKSRILDTANSRPERQSSLKGLRVFKDAEEIIQSEPEGGDSMGRRKDTGYFD